MINLRKNMTKKFLKEKLKSQKGITAADALIALLLVLVSISIIGMIYLNITTITRMTNAKTGATRIATNLIENIKGTYYEFVQNTNIVGNGQSVYNTKIPKGYTVNITVEAVENDNNNLAKKVTVEVSYNPNNNSEKVSLTTAIEREIIRECNSPNFSDGYIEQLVGEGNDYQFYQSLDLLESDKKIIFPIKYNGENYVLVNSNQLNDLWYSYSGHQWARVLVFDDSADLLTYIDTNSNMVIDNSILKDEDKSFVWIPRFKIDETVSPNVMYFMYKDTNYSIKKQMGNNEYYCINFDESLNNRLRSYFVENVGESSGVGKWFKYYYVKNLNLQDNQIVKKIYESNYGPLFEI